MNKDFEQIQAKEQRLTAEYLMDKLDYNPETGIFIWKKPASNNIKPGTIAGTINHGYVSIKLDKVHYLAHRLAWLYYYKEWPKGENYYIDHINGDRADNRIINLRLVTKSYNSKNRGAQQNNTTGIIGVTFTKLYNRWTARINVNGERIVLGHFKKFEDAIKARKEAEKKYGYIIRNG